MPDAVRVTVTNEALHPVSDLLFGQFLERPSWGGETGPEAAVVPGTGDLEPRVAALLRTMAIPIVRFPGGTDVDYLDWRDLVTDAHGPHTGRPTSRGHQGQTVTNAFGYDEYFRLAATLAWRRILVVNLRAGLLTDTPLAAAAAHAAALLAYCAGDPATVPEALRAWPALRAANGHPAPYAVDYVQIGNETWFWVSGMKAKHGDAWVTAWADAVALRAVQPDVKVIADGHPLEVAAELHRRQLGIALYALHRYYPMGIRGLFAPDGQRRPETAVTPRQVWETLVHSTETDAHGLAEWQDAALDQARRLGYQLALTEWNLNAWWSLERRAELWPGPGACGLGAAVMLQATLRRGDRVALATQSMLVGQRWGIAGIRVQPESGQAPALQPTAEVVTLYSRHHGDQRLPVRYAADAPQWQAEIHFSPDHRPCATAALVDVVATRDRDRLYLHAVNTDSASPRMLTVNLDGFGALPARAAWHRLCFRAAAEAGTTGAWTATETGATAVRDAALTLTLPPRSATIAVLDLEPGLGR